MSIGKLRPRGTSGLALKASAIVAATTLVVAGLSLPANASVTDASESEGLMLSGGGIINLDDVASLAGAYSANGDGLTHANPLDLTALNLLNLDLGSGLRLFGAQSALQLGAVGQYASSNNTQSIASSGLIGSDGSIAVGTGAPGENSSLDLAGPIAALGVQDIISELKLELGALSARASVTPGDPSSAAGTYQVANAKLRVTSPTVSNLATDLDSTLSTASTSLNAITGTGGALDGLVDDITTPLTSLLSGLLLGVAGLEDVGITGTVDLDLSTALNSVTQQQFVSGPVTLNLATGQVVIDLSTLYTLNSLAPNTVLLNDATINAQITTALSDILTNQLPTAVVTAVTGVLNTTALHVEVGAKVTLGTGILKSTIGNLQININGTLGGFLGLAGQTAPVIDLGSTSLLGLPVGTLLSPVTALVTGTVVPLIGGVVQTALNFNGLKNTVTALGTTAVTALQPLLATLNEIVNVTINVQESPGNFRDGNGLDTGSFTQRAIGVKVLPNLTNLIQLNLASATVRTNAAAAQPTISSLAPTSGPETGGTSVVITGTGLTGATGVDFGGTPATSFTVDSDTQITAVSPAHAAGAADVTVTTPGGTSLPGTFTFTPVAPAVTTITPNQGPEAGGTVVTLTGTGFTGSTAVTFDGTAGTAFTVDSDTQITVTTPAHAAAATDVVVENPTGDSDPVTFTYLPSTAATVSGLAPATGPETGGTVVTVTGTNFTNATGVTFDGTAGTSFTVDSDTQITVTSPAHAPGAVDVVVESPDGDSAAAVFTYTPVTKIDTVDPETGPEAGGTTVVITGSCFTGATDVLFGSTPATSFTVDSDTQITATVPAGTGVVDIRVVGGGTCGEGEIPGGFTYVEQAVITGLSPDHGPVAGGTSVTVTGTGFTDATGVTFDGTPGTSFTVVSDTEITVTTPPGAAGAADVVVQKPDGTSDPATFTYDPNVVATSLTPVTGPETGGTAVTITGTGFTGALGVTFGGTAGTSFTVVSDTEITVTTPAHVPGTVDAVVVSLLGNAAPLDFTFSPVTKVDTAAPSTGPEVGGTSVTITGSCFTAATGVTFGGTPATSFTVDSDTQITAVAPAGTGAVDIVVTGGGTCGTGTLDDGFTYVPDTTATIAGLAPATGPETGGTVVTVTGNHFTGATGVTFDGTDGTAFTVDSDTQITVTTPAHAAGAVDVIVVKAGGNSAAETFTYTPVTTVDVVDPNTGPEDGGTAVTITGSCFTGATGVFFGTTPATSFTVVSDTEITAVAPAGTGVVDIRVVGGGTCGEGEIPGGFTYVEQAVITGLAPDRGPEAGGTAVTVTGTGFTDASGVTFDGTPGTSFTVVSDTEITVTSPAHAAGVTDVVVEKTDGASDPADFTYFAVAAIDSVTPVSGPEAGGTSVTIAGTCFTGATGVSFGSTPATSFTVVSDTEITAVTPAGVGAVDVTVTGSAECGNATLDDGFTYLPGSPVDAVITTLAPVRGPEIGGTSVTITGSNFTGATAVDVDGVDVADYTVVSDTEITFVTEAHAPGSVPVTVERAAGDSNTAQFTFYPVTTVDAVTPGVGPEAGGIEVTISGHCFLGATGVLFGTVPATSFTVVNDTTITAIEPAGTGVVDIIVQGAGECGTGEIDDGFTYLNDTAIDVPVLTGMTPVRGPDTGGTAVTITGSGFTDATSVTFDGIAGVDFTVVSDTEITAVTPPHAAETVPVVVLTPDDAPLITSARASLIVAAAASNALQFTYEASDGTVNPTTPGGGSTGGTGSTGGGGSGGGSLAVTGAGDTFGVLGAALVLVISGLVLTLSRRGLVRSTRR